jgi:predicted Zn-dependent protease
MCTPGKADLALTDATMATQLLAADTAADPLQLSKAYFRRATALLSLGRAEKAVACYRRCARVSGEDPVLLQSLSEAVGQLPLSWLAQVRICR